MLAKYLGVHRRDLGYINRCNFENRVICDTLSLVATRLKNIGINCTSSHKRSLSQATLTSGQVLGKLVHCIYFSDSRVISGFLWRPGIRMKDLEICTNATPYLCMTVPHVVDRPQRNSTWKERKFVTYVTGHHSPLI